VTARKRPEPPQQPEPAPAPDFEPIDNRSDVDLMTELAEVAMLTGAKLRDAREKAHALQVSAECYMHLAVMRNRGFEAEE
jgi:hypothetical protein